MWLVLGIRVEIPGLSSRPLMPCAHELYLKLLEGGYYVGAFLGDIVGEHSKGC